MRHFIILAGLAALAAAIPVDMSTDMANDMANDMAHDKALEMASDVSYGKYSPYKYYGSYGDYDWKAAGEDEAKTGMENMKRNMMLAEPGMAHKEEMGSAKMEGNLGMDSSKMHN
ncbi:hypothetical protein IQ07DRAFT_639095 [Pyrenochaeta sp. DS3sAY3a]|nr:hypothetical protein IQ07DRAFT_639095 [Pyrenochaeta sp. DS3sAY3a]